MVQKTLTCIWIWIPEPVHLALLEGASSCSAMGLIMDLSQLKLIRTCLIMKTKIAISNPKSPKAHRAAVRMKVRPLTTKSEVSEKALQHLPPHPPIPFPLSDILDLHLPPKQNTPLVASRNRKLLRRRK
jgi:hypothetical protein